MDSALCVYDADIGATFLFLNCLSTNMCCSTLVKVQINYFSSHCVCACTDMFHVSVLLGCLLLIPPIAVCIISRERIYNLRWGLGNGGVVNRLWRCMARPGEVVRAQPWGRDRSLMSACTPSNCSPRQPSIQTARDTEPQTLQTHTSILFKQLQS